MENSNSLLKILTTIGFISLTVCSVILAKTPSATGYEISIYDAYPWYFWWFVVLTIISGLLILVDNAFSEHKSNLYLLGYFFILLSNFIVLILPVLRGYAFYGRDDALSHLGYAKDILFTGHTGASNFYPLSHILVAIISITSGLDSTLTLVVTPSIFYLVYATTIFLLARVISKSLGQALLVTLFAILLPIGIYSTEFYPVGLSFLMIPFILYLYFQKNKKQSFQFTTLFVILSLAMVFLHPLASIYLIFIFLIYGFSTIVYNYLKGEKEYILSIYSKILNPVLIISVTFFTWISSFTIFGQRVEYLFHWLIAEAKRSYIATYQAAVEKAGFTTYQFFDLFFRMYGSEIIYLAFFMVAISVVLKKISFNRSSLFREDIFFALLSASIGISSVVFLFAGFDVLATPLRLLTLFFICCAISNGLTLYECISKRKSKVYLLTSLLILSSVLGIFGVHSSPWVKTPNHAVSFAEFTGGEWLAKEGELATKIIPVASQFGWRMRDATLGFEIGNKGRFGSPPPHLGYDSNNSVSYAFKEKVYIVITDFDRRYYTDLWPTQGSFYISDFEKLNSDSAANLIYTNKGFIIYYHEGGKS